ncbi:hypothetical protein KGP36_02265 [Patescibacteria group bacterium]|nr:hypothetical protein [Patescibacteria group bacterium]
MADTNQQTTPPANAPAVKTWTPKIGETCLYTIEDKRLKAVVTRVFIVTGSTSTKQRKKDAKGQFVQTTKEVKINNVTKTVNDFVFEDVVLYEGVAFSANQQFPESIKGITLDALSPKEA